RFLGLFANFQNIEQNLAKLARGIEIEIRASKVANCFLQLGNLFRKLRTEIRKCIRIHRYPFIFHVREDRNQWRFDFIKDSLLTPFLELRFEGGAKLKGYVRNFRRIFSTLLYRQICEIKLRAFCIPRNFRKRDGTVTKISFSQIISAVAHVRLDEAVRDHGVENLATHNDAVPFEQIQREFEIVA